MGFPEEYAWGELPDPRVKARQTKTGRQGDERVLEGTAYACCEAPEGIIPP
jgi:hypothetical protein